LGTDLALFQRRVREQQRRYEVHQRGNPGLLTCVKFCAC